MRYRNRVSDDLLRPFRRVAFLEGVSLLLLLGIAMPLKYYAGMPLAVRVVGMTHGVLFLVYVAMIGMLVQRSEWSKGRAAVAVVLGVLPFGTFALDRTIERDLVARASRG
jgi:integral membrane protein